MTIRLIFACLLLFILGCSKSDETAPTNQPLIPEPSIIDNIEREFGIVIPDKDKLSKVTLRISGGLMTINAIKNNKPIALVADIEAKTILSQFEFNPDTVVAKLPYGELSRIKHTLLNVFYKTSTHLYGISAYNADEHSESRGEQALFVGEIKTSKVIENDPVNNLKFDYFNWHFTFGPWYNSLLLITSRNSYRVVDNGNITIAEGTHIDNLLIRSPLDSGSVFFAASNTQAISYFNEEHFNEDGGLRIYSYETNKMASIRYKVRNNSNDKVEIKSVNSDGKIAVIFFKITSFSGEVTEKTAKVDLLNLKVL